MSLRRKFIKDSCTACLGFMAFSSVASLLSSCASLRVYSATIQNDLLQIPLESIHPEEKMKIIRSKTLAYDVLLILKEDKMHKAFLMKCSHQDNILVANKNGMSCNLHGSTFDLNGNVITGPASKPLQNLKTETNSESITIYLS